MLVRNVKLVFLGDRGVGKSSMLFRMTLEHFTGSIDTNLGSSFLSKSIQLDGTTYKFQIWDTPGQEGLLTNYSSQMHGASAIVIVYDVTNKNSFANATTSWWKKVQKHGSANLVVALVGNKCDLEASRKVKTTDGKSFADSNGAVFVETSALTSTNLVFLLQEIAQKLPPTSCEEVEAGNDSSSKPVSDSTSKTSKKSGCNLS
ncbi:ras-related protein Rab-5A-like isoform X1 [Octopus bimaculoides]|uniref:ras-related protein Rab-5A-like isoform X1 n=2 Tax=Octopus bimaculoides TaxID=37653 RepID=UPI0022E06CB2|nr:ras-related protein Rab-5A-like isoform X1 [Octopus bimaculoides]